MWDLDYLIPLIISMESLEDFLLKCITIKYNELVVYIMNLLFNTCRK